MEISTEPTKTTAKGCIILFGLIFFLVGLGVGFGTLRGITKSIGAKSWVPTEAVIIDASLKVSRGDDSDTYRATGEFRYEWDGKVYTSDQVFFSKSSDSNRNFHNRIVREMRTSRSRNQPMIAYVNPDTPGQAVLYPQIRWGMVGFMTLFSVLFGGVGALIIAGGQYAGRVIEQENKRKILHPERPWLWKDEWQTAEIKNSSKAKFYGALGFSVLWNLISLPLIFIVPNEIFEKKNYIATIGLLFPIIGIALAVWTFNIYRKWKRFGDTSLVLNTYPAALGHALQGKLIFKEELPPETKFNIKLSNIYKYSTGSGDDRRTVEDIKWQDEQQIPLSAGYHSNAFALPITFRLPTKEHPSAWGDDDREYIWRLNIEADMDDVDFDQQFDVPVFDPQTYNIRIPASAQLDQSDVSAAAYTYQGDWQKTGVQAFEIPGGHAYYFKAARHKLMGASLVFMAAIFGGIGLIPIFSDMPVFMGLIFAGFGVLLAWFSCTLWFYKTQIETTNGSLSVRSGMLNGSYKTVEIEDIEKIDMTSTMSSGNTRYYDVFAKTTSGDKIKMAIHLLGKRDVQALIDKIEKDLGMKSRL